MATVAAAWTSGVLDPDLRALRYTLNKVGFASRRCTPWTFKMSVRICSAVICRAEWPLLKKCMKRVRFSSARDWMMLVRNGRSD